MSDPQDNPNKKLNPLKKRKINREQLKLELRRKQVAANILAGATYREIAEALDVSPATIVKDFKAVIQMWREHYARDADDHIKVMARRYEQMYNALHPKMMKGDTAAILAGCQVLDRLSKLLGIDVDKPLVAIPNEIRLVWDDKPAAPPTRQAEAEPVGEQDGQDE